MLWLEIDVSMGKYHFARVQDLLSRSRTPRQSGVCILFGLGHPRENREEWIIRSSIIHQHDHKIKLTKKEIDQAKTIMFTNKQFLIILATATGATALRGGVSAGGDSLTSDIEHRSIKHHVATSEGSIYGDRSSGIESLKTATIFKAEIEVRRSWSVACSTWLVLRIPQGNRESTPLPPTVETLFISFFVSPQTSTYFCSPPFTSLRYH